MASGREIMQVSSRTMFWKEINGSQTKLAPIPVTATGLNGVFFLPGSNQRSKRSINLGQVAQREGGRCSSREKLASRDAHWTPGRETSHPQYLSVPTPDFRVIELLSQNVRPTRTSFIGTLTLQQNLG
jgi:hypothetical protein